MPMPWRWGCSRLRTSGVLFYFTHINCYLSCMSWDDSCLANAAMAPESGGCQFSISVMPAMLHEERFLCQALDFFFFANCRLAHLCH